MSAESKKDRVQFAETRIVELSAALAQLHSEISELDMVDPEEQQMLSDLGGKIEMLKQAIDTNREELTQKRNGRRKKLSELRERVAALRARLKSRNLNSGG